MKSHKLTQGPCTCTIVWDEEWQEYIARFWFNEVELTEGSYHTDDLEDALATARMEMKFICNNAFREVKRIDYKPVQDILDGYLKVYSEPRRYGRRIKFYGATPLPGYLKDKLAELFKTKYGCEVQVTNIEAVIHNRVSSVVVKIFAPA